MKILSKQFSWNCRFGSFKLFPNSKIDFGHFWNGKKWILVKKNFSVKLIYFISRVFLAWTLKFSAKWRNIFPLFIAHFFPFLAHYATPGFLRTPCWFNTTNILLLQKIFLFVFTTNNNVCNLTRFFIKSF